MIRNEIIIIPECARVHKKEETAKSNIPKKYSFLRPKISARRPAGTKNAATAKTHPLLIHPKDAAGMPSSLPIEGKAIFIQGFSREVVNETRQTFNRSIFLLILPDVRSILFFLDQVQTKTLIPSLSAVMKKTLQQVICTGSTGN
jgi:hypothetical protein